MLGGAAGSQPARRRQDCGAPLRRALKCAVVSTAANQVVDFVRALALGWKNLAAYPPGHPSLVRSLNLIHQRLADLRGPAGEIVLGIARDGVVYGEEKIDSTYAQKFGNALYTRGVAVLRFDLETKPEAVEKFLRL